MSQATQGAPAPATPPNVHGDGRHAGADPGRSGHGPRHGVHGSRHRPRGRRRPPPGRPGPGDPQPAPAGRDRRLPALRGAHRAAADPVVAGQPDRRGRHRAADPGTGDQDQPAARRRARDERVPDRWPRAGRAAGGVRRGDRPDGARDHRRGRRPACRPGRAQRAVQHRARLRRRHGAGAGQQPAGPAGRRRVPAQGQQRAALDRAADRRPAGRRQLDPDDRRDGGPPSVAGAPAGAGRGGCCSGWRTAGSGGGSTAG